MLFAALRRMRAAEREMLPFVETMVDRDILIALGMAQEEGRHLGLKQLALLNLASIATLRRRLSRLVKLGCLERYVQEDDGRVTRFVINKRFRKRVEYLSLVLKAVAHQVVMTEAGMAEQGNGEIIGAARSCGEAMAAVRAVLEPQCRVNSLQVSCVKQPAWSLFVMADVENNGQEGAARLGGVLFGQHLICVDFPVPVGFNCGSLGKCAICLNAGKRPL